MPKYMMPIENHRGMMTERKNGVMNTTQIEYKHTSDESRDSLTTACPHHCTINTINTYTQKNINGTNKTS